MLAIAKPRLVVYFRYTYGIWELAPCILYFLLGRLANRGIGQKDQAALDVRGARLYAALEL